MKLEWVAVPSSSTQVSHPVILRTRLPHGWLVAAQVHGGYTITFVPDPPGEGTEWSPPTPAT
jgi:hypothetical protein